ncbi:MAG: hypothetical protein APF81_26740 [Desulfosporosinus sp. BRH_c37]|nr:MAG: hypothetical protein APF81_26740 [Desulfosporosinus sp. BRH_c37]
MKKLNLKWVADSIGEDYKKWKRGDIILLEAQTGTGKTWFIKNVLIDYLGDNEKLLFVCNRTNLKRQLKKDLLEKFNEKIPSTTKELDDITTINNITITSYHAIQYSARDEIYDGKKFDLGLFDFIILDECHYIMADGSFNNKCRFAYEKLVYNMSRFATKIFISATMQEIKDPIIRCANRGFGKLPKVREYSTGIDYSYIHPIYYKNDMTDIINTIKNDKTDEKWLVFISDLKDGEKILKELGKDNSSLIKSGTISDELDSVINNSKFNKKVLIATKAMDNGINISDPKLTNIVIMAWDKITFIQMLGRKRIQIDEPWQNINLYIPTRMKKSFLTKLHLYDLKQAEIDLIGKDKNAFDKKYDNDLKDFKDYNDIFYRNKTTGDWKVNSIGYLRLMKDTTFAKYMIEKFDTEGEFAFVQEQLSWLGLENTFDESNLIDGILFEEDLVTFEELIKKLVGIQVLKEDQIKLKELLTSEAFQIDRSLLRGTKKMHPDTFNSIMKNTLKLPYEVTATKTSKWVEGKPKKYTYWTISSI